MKMRCLFLVFIISAAVCSTPAQSKTVTNADLVKYKQERLKAEADPRENYAKLAFSSPEELERRDALDTKERSELSARLHREELERDRIEAEREAAERLAVADSRPTQIDVVTDNGFPGYFWSYGRRHRIPVFRGDYQQSGYFAGGQFWPTGSRTRPQTQSVWIRPRH